MTAPGAAKVLVAGGGVAALETALALRALAADRVSVELLAPEPHFWYRPLAVAEPFALGEAKRFELAELAGAAGATVALGSLVAVDAGAHRADTAAGGEIPYDLLVVACGAIPTAAIPGALTFRGPADVEKLAGLLEELVAGGVRRVAFAVPWGAVWSLPAYELALLTAAHVRQRGAGAVEVALVTPEEQPLQLFGRDGSDAVRELLDARGVTVHAGCLPLELAGDQLRMLPDGQLEVDRVVALPRLRGPRIDGLAQTAGGFIPVDRHGRVEGFGDVYAAGDITSFAVKQGGLAAQQADAVAEAIAAAVGADVEARPFRPVLRGLLLTGRQPRYLRRELSDGDAEAGSASLEPLWWPPAKIVGRHLAPFLASVAGHEAPSAAGAPPGAVAVEVEMEMAIESLELPAWTALHASLADGADDEPTVAAAMSPDPLVVAPEDTLGEVAEQMQRRDVGSAAVAEYGRLIGVLTSRDLLQAFAARVHSSEARVRAWMTAQPFTVTPATTLAAAVLLMTEHGFHHLPVVEGTHVVGMLGLRQAASRAPRKTGIGLGF